ncbi:reverse transcriptase domain-containing protein [Tanacetum coccineum]
MSKIVIYADHSALKYLSSKQDAKPRLIRWVLLLQEFTIEVKDKKGTKNLVADHLSRLENPELEKLNEEAIRDSFPDEHLMAVHVKEVANDHWYADYANFLVSKIIPHGLMYRLRKKFLSDSKHYIWDDPYLFKSYPNGIIRRCVFGKELRAILEHCHMGLTGGHYGDDITTRKMSQDFIGQLFLRMLQEGTVNGNRKEWTDKLDDALWAFRTAYKSPVGSIPFKIAYGKACHLPIKMEHKAYWALKNVNLDLDTAGKHRRVEVRDKNGVNFKVNGHRLKKYYSGDINALRETLYFAKT